MSNSDSNNQRQNHSSGAFQAQQIKALEAEYGETNEMTDVMESGLQLRELKRTKAKAVTNHSRIEGLRQEAEKVADVSQESQKEQPGVPQSAVPNTYPAKSAPEPGRDSVLPTALQVTGTLSPENPLYHPDWKMSDAEVYLGATIHTYLEHCIHWTNDMPINAFREMTKKPGNTKLRQMCRTLAQIAEFLRVGRSGWDLVWFSGKFSRDIEPILIRVRKMLETLANYEGCWWLANQAVASVITIHQKLARLYLQRRSILMKRKEEIESKTLERELEAAFAEDTDIIDQGGGGQIVAGHDKKQTAGYQYVQSQIM